MNIIGLISHASLVEFTSFSCKQAVEIFCKMELMKSGGLIKNRIVLSMIEVGEKAAI